MNANELLNKNNPTVTITVKNMGDITLELFPQVAPNTVNNFIKYIEKNYYDNLIFHRVIPNFMIQGGWGKNIFPPIKGEFKQNGFDNQLVHTKGVISMARTMDKNSQTAQFFIMHKDSPHLDGAYAAFGVLTSGYEIVDKIARVPRDQMDKPKEDIVIEKVTLSLNGYTPEEPIYFI
ncbi:Peptidyl-prolyl cis-trans isomerase [Alteracholeplasma palmae J233]|uniref:Peptidyl-prolyl cis-trans isomerase n=1 Tax=Alteracholeplasma palmae (strain ATCC 49389 / J233) TaxID=1318466 RepID=U4KKB6_ALTPJ|nr:peptidylprolyl isomerase [Alteracholeplasma palmae]CCV64149.1 Peptidyl-prolyl cis-trans isomerase [Alteracholeplasma palmae J233]